MPPYRAHVTRSGEDRGKTYFLKNASRLQPGIGKGLQRHCQPKQPRNTTGVASTRPAHPLRSSTPIYRHPRPPSRTRNPSVIPDHTPVIPDHDRGPATTHPSPPTTIANPQPICRPRPHTRHPRPPFPVIPDPPQMSFRAKSRNLSRSCTIPTFPNGPRPSSPTTHPSSPTPIGDLLLHIRHPRPPSRTRNTSVIPDHTPVIPDPDREPAATPKKPLFPRHTPTDADKESVSESPLNNILSFLGVDDPFVNRIRRAYSDFLRIQAASSH